MTGSKCLPLLRHAKDLVSNTTSTTSDSLDDLAAKLKEILHSLSVTSRSNKNFSWSERTELWELICALWVRSGRALPQQASLLPAHTSYVLLCLQNLCVESSNQRASMAPDVAELKLRRYARQVPCRH